MTEPFLGEIRVFPYNFAPRGWAYCSGQLQLISQNTALFSLLGTQYGGNGQTTFALPDFRSRVAIGFGNGPGLPSYQQGQFGGEERHTLLVQEMPQHTHGLGVNASVDANSNTALAAAGNTLGRSSGRTSRGQDFAYNIYNSALTSPTAAASGQVGLAGNNQPHDNIQPYNTLSYCIALEGIFPSRN